MSTTRLDRRLAELLGCPRGEARRLIEGGWVSLDGQVIEQPQLQVPLDAQPQVDSDGTDAKPERVSMLLHKPAGMAASALCALVTPQTRSPLDAGATRPLQRHFHGLQLAASLPADDSGVVVVSQDPRILGHLQQLARLEQEFLVEVRGERAMWDLARLQRGLQAEGRPLHGCRISWQNEQRLRFAGKGLSPRVLREACASAEMQVVAIRRLRIGSIALGPLAPGHWRYVGSDERF